MARYLERRNHHENRDVTIAGGFTRNRSDRRHRHSVVSSSDCQHAPFHPPEESPLQRPRFRNSISSSASAHVVSVEEDGGQLLKLEAPDTLTGATSLDIDTISAIDPIVAEAYNSSAKASLIGTGLVRIMEPAAHRQTSATSCRCLNRFRLHFSSYLANSTHINGHPYFP
jgi:hypothetical protein